MDIAKKRGGGNLGEIQELKDTTSEDNMMKIGASEPVPEEEEDEEAVPERKLTCVNLAEGSDYSKLLFTFTSRTVL